MSRSMTPSRFMPPRGVRRPSLPAGGPGFASAAILIFLLAAGCTLPSPGPAPSGSGALDLPQPAVGLEGLVTYRATLIQRFEGEFNGSPHSWEETATLVVNRSVPGRVVTVDHRGAAGATTAYMRAEQGGLSYRRPAGGPCSAVVTSEEGISPAISDPADLLPPAVSAAFVEGPITKDGTPAIHYRLNTSTIDPEGSGEGEGEVWVAEPGGWIVRYALTFRGGAEHFGQGIQGTMNWDYTLGQAGQPLELELPPDCPPGLVDIPLLPDARNVRSHPGFLFYDTATPVDEAAAYYLDALPSEGWGERLEPLVAPDLASLEIERQGLHLSLLIANGTVRARLGRAEAATVAPLLPTATPELATNLVGVLNRTLGIGQTSVFPSFHLEARGTEPSLDRSTGQVHSTIFQLSADVKGEDIFLDYGSTSDSGVVQSTQGYRVGGREYEIVAGAVQESLGTISLTWASWPLNPVLALAVGTAGASLQGDRVVDGRPVLIYEIDSDRADPALLAQIWSYSDVKSARGTLTVDKESGGLLAATLDYTVEYAGPATGEIVRGDGNLELEISQIGTVEVQLP